MHLAIIPDGNRRWAKTRGLLPWNGHERAIGNFRELTEWCRNDPRVDILTVWGFSTENWKRDSAEVSALMRIYEEYLRRERVTFVERKTRFLHSGRSDRIPPSLAALIAEVEEETKEQRDFTLHFALDYGGKDEIIRAINRYVRTTNQQPVRTARPGGPATSNESDSEMSESVFRSFLDQPSLPDIDLVLRTSGEQRMSNFFLWQSAYAEWFFLEKLFPEVTADDLGNVLDEYERRKRRFGS